MERFKGKCLDVSNVQNYLKEKYKANTCVLSGANFATGKSGLLQRDYGKENDCTITTITDLLRIKFYDTVDPSIVYNVVEKKAQAFGYTGEKIGTNPLTINSIMKEISKNLLLPCRTKSKYVKGLPIVGWNKKDIIKSIDLGNPVILNIFRDGRQYYDSHSILVVGYSTYLVDDKEVFMLLVHDNWHKDVCIVDYDLLFISSINYLI